MALPGSANNQPPHISQIQSRLRQTAHTQTPPIMIRREHSENRHMEKSTATEQGLLDWWT